MAVKATKAAAVVVVLRDQMVMAELAVQTVAAHLLARVVVVTAAAILVRLAQRVMAALVARAAIITSMLAVVGQLHQVQPEAAVAVVMQT
jgi:hypothetical protein